MAKDLQGKRIIVTREASQGKAFAEKISLLNGIPLELPLLRISCKKAENQEQIFNNSENYDWIILTSANGVNCFFKQFHSGNHSFSADVKLAVVGSKTEAALKQYGYDADLVPDIYDAESLAKIFLPKYENGERILLVRGNRSLDTLPKKFKEKGIGFDSIEVYETTMNEPIKDELYKVISNKEYDYITFTSPSTVQAFVELYGMAVDSPCVCIGTTTEKAARDSGFTHILTARTFTIEGMLEIMVEDQS